jgi:hypothetical protein
MACLSGATDSTNFPLRNALDSSHNGGFDAFVTVLGPTGNTLQFASYFGSSGGDCAASIGFDNLSVLYVSGWCSSGFPTTPGAYDTSFNGNCDAFVMKISNY